MREYVPRQPEAPSTDTPSKPATPAVTKTPWERGPLPPWARRWTSHDAARATGPNLTQRIVLILSFLVILGMALFPPWVYVFNPAADLRDRFVRTERPAGYHFLFADHTPQDQSQLLATFNLTPKSEWEWLLMGLAAFSIRLDTTRPNSDWNCAFTNRYPLPCAPI